MPTSTLVIMLLVEYQFSKWWLAQSHGESGRTWYSTRGRVTHYGRGCPEGRSIQRKNLREGVDSGRRPCRLCLP